MPLQLTPEQAQRWHDMKNSRFYANKIRKISDEKIAEVKQALSEDWSVHRIKRECCVSGPTIRKIKTGWYDD